MTRRIHLLHGLLILTSSCGSDALNRPPSQTAPRSSAGAGAGTSQPPRASELSAILPAWAIRDIQRALRARGHALEVTASFDRRTESSLSSFQRKQALAATGMPDLTTVRRLGLDPLPIYRDVLQR